MKHLTKIALAAMAMSALLAMVGAGSAAATELYKATAESNDTLANGTEIAATMKSGSSLLIKDTGGLANNTCTGSEIKGTVENAGTSTGNPISKTSSLTFSGCSSAMTVLAPGELEIKSIAGTTSGTVVSKGMRVTFKSTLFGVSCVVASGTGTTLGTLTGAATGESATLHVNGVVTIENGCGDSTLTGTYLVTNPTGLVVEDATATELYKATAEGNDTLANGTEIAATLKSGSSLLLKDTGGLANNTCTGSEIKGTVENAGTSTGNPISKTSSLTFSGCSSAMTVLAPGELEIKSIAGTTNGTVVSKGMRVTFKSPLFGVSCVVASGTGAALGTLTGAKTGELATFDVDGVVTLENGCGDSTLTGTYLVTSPTGLRVEGS